MALPERNPHDALYKAVFARPENALALLRSGLPAEVVDFLDPASLRIWEEHPDARRLPVIVPLVLHQGPSPWSQARSMAELFDAPPDVVELLGSLVPVLDLAFDDLGEQSVAGAAAAGAPVLARLARGLLRAMADPRMDPGLVFESLADLLHGLIGQPGGSADLRLLVLYTVLVHPGVDVADLRDRVRRVAGEEAGEIIMSTAQQLIEQGQVQAMRRMLTRQLGARFGSLPASVVARIEKAGVDEIDAWSLRILEAKALDDVFAPR